MAKITVVMYGRKQEVSIKGNLVVTPNRTRDAETGETIVSQDLTHVVNSTYLANAINAAKKAGVVVGADKSPLRYAFTREATPEMVEAGKKFFLAIPGVKKEYDKQVAEGKKAMKAASAS